MGTVPPEPAGPDPRVGEVIGDKYRIEARIGHGGMGLVYAATQLALGERVALKMLRSLWAAEPEIRERFRREAIALARLRHPNIVSLLDFGEHEGAPYLVMELVQGRSLGDRIAEGPLGALEAGTIFDPILQVLQLAHSRGIVHRDLKPENVMLVGEPAPQIKVLDFGLAYLAGSNDQARLTESGTVRGTPHFMSPEQCRGNDVGPPTDVYAVGVMLYEALTGHLPFDGGDAATIMSQHMFVEVPAMEAELEVPRGVEALVKRALAKRASDRPSASEMRELLAAAVRGTDPIAMAERNAAERTREAALSRSDRAPTSARRAPASVPETSDGLVVLWIEDRFVASRVQTSLSVHGIAAKRWSEERPPPAEVDGAPVRAILVGGPDAGVARTKAVRAADPIASLPTLAIGARGPEETRALVRAGASDALLESDGDDALVAKVRRLLRRGR